MIIVDNGDLRDHVNPVMALYILHVQNVIFEITFRMYLRC